MEALLELHLKIVDIAKTFHSEFFANLKKIFEDIQLKTLRIKNTLVGHLKTIDTVIENTMQELEKCVTVLKSYLDSFLEKYDSFLRKYSGGSSKAFLQFVIKVKADVLKFLEEFRNYMDKYKTVKEISVLYKDLENWLEYVNFSQHFHETTERFSR